MKNGTLWNPSSNVVTGFVKEELNTNDMLQEKLGMNKRNTATENIYLFQQINGGLGQQEDWHIIVVTITTLERWRVM